MAAYGGHNDATGLQIFVTARRGAQWPPSTVDVRVRYDQTIGDLRAAAARALGLPDPSLLQLWRHKRELVASEWDHRTLLECDIHTGFGVQAWDMRDPPAYWPPVKPAEGEGQGGLELEV